MNCYKSRANGPWICNFNLDNTWIGREILTFDDDFELKKRIFTASLYKDKVNSEIVESIYEGYILIDSIAFDWNFDYMLTEIFESNAYKTFFLKNKSENLSFFFLAKICYLATYFCQHKAFINPSNVFYNPRTGYNNIHPGIGRYLTLLLLNEKKIYSLYFNTKGCKKYITTDLDKISLEAVHLKYPECKIGFTLDHGAMIPQFSFIDNTSEIKERNSYINQFADRLSNLKIRTNVNNNYLNQFLSTDPTVEINFLHAKINSIDIIRSLVFSLINKNFSSNTLEVKNL